MIDRGVTLDGGRKRGSGVDGLVGRDREVAAALDLAIASGPWRIVVEGEPGIGKTALLESIAMVLATRATVLQVTAVSAESSLSYAGLSEILELLLEVAGSRLPEPQQYAVDVTLLRRAAPRDGMHVRAVGSALRTLLEEASSSQPIVLVIDDAQWLDPATVGALAYAHRRVRVEPIGLLLARRQPVLDDGLEQMIDGSFRRIDLGGLSLDAIRRIVGADLGAPGRGLSVRRIYEACEGNPLLAIELARAHASGGAPLPDVGVRLSETLGQLHQTRLDELSDSARWLALLVAAHGRPSERLLGRIDPALRAGLCEAVERRVLRMDGDEVTFTHPLLASAAYESSRPDHRRRAHAALARCTSGEQHARHLALAASRRSERTAEKCEEASLAASRSGAFSAAAELAELSSRLTPFGRGQDARRRARLEAECLFEAGDPDRARSILAAITPEAVPGEDRARTLELAARLAFFERVPTDTVALLQEALVEAAGITELEAELHLQLAWSSRLPAAECATHAAAAVRLLGDDGNPALRSRALLAVAYVKMMRGEIDLSLIDRAETLAGGSHGRRSNESADFFRGLALIAMDEHDLARVAFKGVLERVRLRGEDLLVAEVHRQLGRVEWWAGYWPEAVRHARACQDAADELDHPFLLLHGVLLEAYALCPRDPAGVRLAALIDRLREPVVGQHLSLLAFTKAALGLRAITADLWSDAVVELEVAADVCERLEEASWVFRFEGDYVEALIRSGDVPQARRRIARLQEQASHPNAHWSAIVLARCSGILHAEHGNLHGAEVALQQSCELSTSRLPFEHARSLLELGRVRRRARQKRSARTPLEDAATLFGTLGADAWVAKVKRELDRIGGRPPRSDHLTPAETQTAHLAGTGMTNQAIAAAMFVSVHTVESNLTRVYRKLGVRSRTELAHRGDLRDH